MAIQVNGTQVIGNSRELTNIASLDATTTATINAVVGSSDLAAATGGTVTTDGDYKVHKFTSNGTFSVTTPGPIQYFIVSGGGAGGRGDGGTGQGGGGGGGHFLGQVTTTVAADYTVIVGAGGIIDTNLEPSASGQVSAIYGSEIFNNTVPGGGQGGGYSVQGQSGASGGGGRSGNPGGSGINPWGNDGGDGVSGQDGGPGGGGAGGVGADGTGTSYNGQAGGAGVAYSITGSSLYYAGGGGGGARSTGARGPGGSGIGGDGGTSGLAATAPTANTGSGGGGGCDGYGFGSDGAAGVVIFRYKFQ